MKNCCNYPKIWIMCLYHRVMSQKDADRMANFVDPDQTAPLHCLPRPICPKTQDHYGSFSLNWSDKQMTREPTGPVTLTWHLVLGRERDFAFFHNFKHVYSPSHGHTTTSLRIGIRKPWQSETVDRVAKRGSEVVKTNVFHCKLSF